MPWASCAARPRSCLPRWENSPWRGPRTLAPWLGLAGAEYLSALARNKAAAVRQAYMVIPYATSKGFEHARAELEARVLMLADALAGARLRLERLSSEALVDLLAHLLRRGRPWRPSEAVEAGAMALYHVSERSVVSGA